MSATVVTKAIVGQFPPYVAPTLCLLRKRARLSREVSDDVVRARGRVTQEKNDDDYSTHIIISRFDDKRHGLLQIWHGDALDALEMEASFVDGNPHGLDRAWHTNGRLLWEKQYIYGKQHGVSRGWFSNGTLNWETNYNANGRVHGLQRCWSMDGRLLSSSYIC